MRAISGEYRGVYWYRHYWGLELAAYNAAGYRISRKYVGNGSDRVTVRGSVAEFRRYIAAGGR